MHLFFGGGRFVKKGKYNLWSYVLFLNMFPAGTKDDISPACGDIYKCSHLPFLVFVAKTSNDF